MPFAVGGERYASAERRGWRGRFGAGAAMPFAADVAGLAA